MVGGLATPVFASVAVAVAYAFAAALVYRVADLLDRGEIPNPVRPNRPGAPPLEPPVSYRWVALAALAVVLVIGATALWRILVTRPRRRRVADRIVSQDFPDPPPEALPRLATVREVVARSQVAEQLGPLFTAFVLLSLIGVATVSLDLIGIGPTELVAKVSRHDGVVATQLSVLTDVGVYVIGLLALGLLVLGVLAYRSPETRRAVAVMWDLGTFWPRTVHPFAPPCYAERAVPELAKRVTALSRRGGVILSGHSHGSVLAAATVLQLPDEVRHRVALLTHGSPLHRIYAQLCPAFLGEPVLREVGERVGWRWINLWRDTDPIGGPLFSGQRPGQPPLVEGPAGTVDRRLRDPRGICVEPEDTVPPPIERHWPYYTDEGYEAAVRDLARRLGLGEGPGPGDRLPDRP